MQNIANVTTVAYVIQQAVAPVFLLTGIGAILAVLTSRLARVVDRYRALSSLSEQIQAQHNNEMDTLSRRARWVHWAVTLCTLAALFICLVIVTLFAGSELGKAPSTLISLLFIIAMLALISGLLCFLREISLATGTIEKPEK